MLEHVFENPPLRAGSPASPARQRAASGSGLAGPPGWPNGVPPPGERGWDHRATAWLLDHCPPDYRLYPAWRRHPVALAWFTVRHLDAQLDAMRSAYREVRVELVDDIGPEVRLLSARRAAGLLLDALRGLEFVPRL